MNLLPALSISSKVLSRIGTTLRRLMPRQKSRVFENSKLSEHPCVRDIYVINLNRCPDRWVQMRRELSLVGDSEGTPLSEMAVRCAAVDARDLEELAQNNDVRPYYTLADQLKVEPQPAVLPDRVDLDQSIPMTLQEVAVAMSHVAVWRKIAMGEEEYALVLEDDVWFRLGFARKVDQAWEELMQHDGEDGPFDILYLSYKEVKDGAQKVAFSDSTFCPVIGLWYMSGYILSRRGARKLLELLPCCGPVDLWVNHQFDRLSVRATRQSIIEQRLDGGSSNLYSILPVLNKIGAINSEGAALFHIRPTEMPVFVFGSNNSGISSVAMALSMLGYRCCSDLETLPMSEYERLMAGSPDRIFNAYANIGSLSGKAQDLASLFPGAKFIVTADESENLDDRLVDELGQSGSVAVLRSSDTNKWRVICEHLRCAPPICSFPKLPDIGQRRINDPASDSTGVTISKALKRDNSPWVIEPRWKWDGVTIATPSTSSRWRASGNRVSLKDVLEDLDPNLWICRNDTFPGNLALFSSRNVSILWGGGAKLRVCEESLGVRSYSAAAVSSCTKYLFGRFEAVIKASNVPGVVTGFFLHRDSPRQEIDIEIPGNRPDRLLVNVFYNPGDEGMRFDYGFRGAPSAINLGFDASQSAHHFAIEWDPGEIRWFVDNRLVHRRSNWAPTPIPHLPMTLHVNAWPTLSKELAGRLKVRLLPASVLVKSIAIDAELSESDRLNGQALGAFDD